MLQRPLCLLVLHAGHPTIAREFFRVSPALLRVLIVVWALAISFSRIALGRHYPSDVLAGAIIGVFALFPIALFVIRTFTSLDGY
jgi:presqualene diphosphate phosphatase